MAKHKVWGQHLLLDIGDCNANICSKNAIAVFVQELADAIGMKVYGKPTIVHFAEHDYDAAGYSLVQLIETSAITGHFSDNNRDAYLDIFSCKNFNKDIAIQVVEKHFAPKKIRAAFLSRGVNLPFEIPFQEYKTHLS